MLQVVIDNDMIMMKIILWHYRYFLLLLTTCSNTLFLMLFSLSEIFWNMWSTGPCQTTFSIVTNFQVFFRATDKILNFDICSTLISPLDSLTEWSINYLLISWKNLVALPSYINFLWHIFALELELNMVYQLMCCVGHTVTVSDSMVGKVLANNSNSRFWFGCTDFLFLFFLQIHSCPWKSLGFCIES